MKTSSRLGQYALSARYAPEVGFIGAEVDLTVRQGQSWELHGVVSNPDGTPCDLSGCSVRGQVRRPALSSSVVVELIGVVTDALEGTFTMALTDVETAALEAGDSRYDARSEYDYDIEMRDAAGRVLPIVWGKFRVHREVTRG